MGETKEVFRAIGPRAITHMWFTIGSPSPTVWKELVLRIFWDGNSRPSAESPLGDFFGLNLGEFYTYQSAFLNAAPNRAVNSWIAMPYRRTPCTSTRNTGKPFQTRRWYIREAKTRIQDGDKNYISVETRGRGHLMGVTMGVLQNQDKWFGEGDEMIFIDSETHPAITGTGTEDYFLGAYDFGGRDHAAPFGHASGTCNSCRPGIAFTLCVIGTRLNRIQRFQICRAWRIVF